MSDPATPNPDESGKATVNVDLSNYVPKAEVSALQSELEKAKDQLLDPGYIDFLNQKKDVKSGADKKASVLFGELTEEEIETLPKTKLLKLAEHRIGQTLTADVKKAFGTRLAAIESALDNVGSYLELQEVKAEFPDFADFKDDVQKILEGAKNDMTIKQAIITAKHNRTVAAAGEKDPKDPKSDEKPLKGGEKPGGSDAAADTEKGEFKTEEDAGKAAFATVKEKYNLTEDKI